MPVEASGADKPVFTQYSRSAMSVHVALTDQINVEAGHGSESAGGGYEVRG